MEEKNKKHRKLTMLLMICVMLVLAGLLVYAVFGKQIVEIVGMLQRGDQDEIMTYLSSQTSVQGYFCLFLLSLIQIVSIVFPCLVVQVAGALIFGWWKAFLLCWAGFVAGNMIVFVVMRIFGKGVSFAFDRSFSDSWLIRTLNSHDPIFAVAMACMIPGIPNGIIPYIAANTAIRTRDFFYAISLSSWIQVVLNCIAGGFLAQGRYVEVAVAFLLEFVIIYLFNKNRDAILERFERG
ncbi:MAG: TVP38/TMEM64 family protein [Bulleidia sp.]